MKNKKNTQIILLAIIALGTSAGFYFFSKQSKLPEKVPVFNENFAYEVILKYETFGPKVPGTKAHQLAGDWMVQELKTMNLLVHEQITTAKTFEGKTIPVRNIIAQFNPSAETRFLLSAHYDNRPFADQESDQKNKIKPVPGVNDGGSGVAILIAMAKTMSTSFAGRALSFGVDFAFWDAEDWGTPSEPTSYCLGSQYWASHLVPARYRAKFGINYDMVGRSGSVFPIDSYSERVAPNVVKEIREAAAELGYQDFFPTYHIGPIVDDHYFVSEITKIPMMDLIYMTPEGRFSPEWHTTHDTSDVISRDILKVVGQTTLKLIFKQP